VDLPQSDPHNTIRPPQTVKPRRVSPRSSPECNLVRNPCVRGGSQADLYDDWICSPYRRMLMFVLTTLESYAHSPNPKYYACSTVGGGFYQRKSSR
jgi:hypothetical protein